MTAAIHGPGDAYPIVHRRSLAGRGLGSHRSSSGDGNDGIPLAGMSAPSLISPPVVKKSTIDSMVSTGTQAEYFSPSQTIILFDWDDTLCPSNWIRVNRPELSFFKPCPTDEKFRRPLRELEIRVEAVLKLALKLGKVVIVTNAMEPWVETSCRNFMPSIVPLIASIPIIYARSVYALYSCEAPRPGLALKTSLGESTSPAMPGLFSASGCNRLSGLSAGFGVETDLLPQLWKEQAFSQELNGFYSRYTQQSWKNILSIGDSIFERDAVRRVVLNRPQQKRCRTKTAKLLDEPSIEDLINQVRIIHDALGLMVQYDGNLEIEIDEDDLQCDMAFSDKIMEG